MANYTFRFVGEVSSVSCSDNVVYLKVKLTCYNADMKREEGEITAAAQLSAAKDSLSASFFKLTDGTNTLYGSHYQTITEPTTDNELSSYCVEQIAFTLKSGLGTLSIAGNVSTTSGEYIYTQANLDSFNEIVNTYKYTSSSSSETISFYPEAFYEIIDATSYSGQTISDDAIQVNYRNYNGVTFGFHVNATNMNEREPIEILSGKSLLFKINQPSGYHFSTSNCTVSTSNEYVTVNTVANTSYLAFVHVESTSNETQEIELKFLFTLVSNSDSSITTDFTGYLKLAVINTYTVTANSNSGTIATTSGWTGTGTSATKSVASGSAIGTLPTATRSGYTLKGWYTAASGGTQVTTSTTISAATTIYAQWEEGLLEIQDRIQYVGDSSDSRTWTYENAYGQHRTTLSAGSYILHVIIDEAISSGGGVAVIDSDENEIFVRGSVSASGFNTAGHKKYSFTLSDEATLGIMIKTTSPYIYYVTDSTENSLIGKGDISLHNSDFEWQTAATTRTYAVGDWVIMRHAVNGNTYAMATISKTGVDTTWTDNARLLSTHLTTAGQRTITLTQDPATNSTTQTINVNATVTFDADGGTAVSSITGTSFTAPSTTKASEALSSKVFSFFMNDGTSTTVSSTTVTSTKQYTFAYWTDGTNKYYAGTSYNLTADLALTAVYTNSTVYSPTTVSVPANPTRSGYSFQGWATNASGSVDSSITAGSTIQATASTTYYYAQWEEVIDTIDIYGDRFNQGAINSKHWAYENSDSFVTLPAGSYIAHLVVLDTPTAVNTNAFAIRTSDDTRIAGGQSTSASGINASGMYEWKFTLSEEQTIGIMTKLAVPYLIRIYNADGTYVWSPSPADSDYLFDDYIVSIQSEQIGIVMGSGNAFPIYVKSNSGTWNVTASTSGVVTTRQDDNVCYVTPAKVGSTRLTFTSGTASCYIDFYISDNTDTWYLIRNSSELSSLLPSYWEFANEVTIENKNIPLFAKPTIQVSDSSGVSVTKSAYIFYVPESYNIPLGEIGWGDAQYADDPLILAQEPETNRFYLLSLPSDVAGSNVTTADVTVEITAENFEGSVKMNLERD